MNKFIIALLLITLTTFGCTDEYDSGGGGGGYGELLIRNQTGGIYITGTFATRCSTSGWGSNQGGVSAGGSLRLTGVQSGCWDVRIETATQGFNFFNNYVSAGETEIFYLYDNATSTVNTVWSEDTYGNPAETTALE